ncbi:SCO3374 family protein [Streptomyces rubrogriseus]|uniref:SCO3374 family protein n=1 Tax=Streptomyces rubrogriseus TaxID=194673 RepID=UPI000D59C9D8|nr:SCO3374 family protein [Streptomyces rubrogriseus]
MVGASHSVPVAPASPVVPSPRRPTGNGGSARERTRWWYESVLGWPTAPGEPVRLRTGVRFDVLDVPTAAGYATLERLGWSGRGPQGFPVAVRGERMLLLVAAGGAEELPGLLEWLEWGSLALDLTAVGADGLVEAPLVPVVPEPRPAGPPRPPERDGVRGAAIWLRPPEPGCGAGSSLPALSALGGAGNALDLVRLVRTLATQCHRVRLTADRPPRARPVTRSMAPPVARVE